LARASSAERGSLSDLLLLYGRLIPGVVPFKVLGVLFDFSSNEVVLFLQQYGTVGDMDPEFSFSRHGLARHN
jgi:hypothetical protein